jgi:hypothetical protein
VVVISEPATKQEASVSVTIKQAEMPASAATSAVIELTEAQRLSDASVEEWFARRHTKDYSDTFIAEVDKRLVMLLARKCLAEPQQALTKGYVADAIAYAISITIFK